MPKYEFMCDACQKPFELTMTMSERAEAKITCPTCNGRKVIPLVGTFMTQTSKKS